LVVGLHPIGSFRHAPAVLPSISRIINL
jgi:hypothetical protein